MPKNTAAQKTDFKQTPNFTILTLETRFFRYVSLVATRAYSAGDNKYLCSKQNVPFLPSGCPIICLDT